MLSSSTQSSHKERYTFLSQQKETRYATNFDLANKILQETGPQHGMIALTLELQAK